MGVSRAARGRAWRAAFQPSAASSPPDSATLALADAVRAFTGSAAVRCARGIRAATIACMEWIAAAVVIVGLLALTILASRRWGAPRSYLGVRGAAWLAVVVMALIVLRLVID